MQYRIRESGEATVIVFEGSLDLSCGRKVREILVELVTRARELIIDLSGVVTADSVLAANLAEAAQLARARSASIVLRGVAPAIQKILELARLSQIFPVESDSRNPLVMPVAG